MPSPIVRPISICVFHNAGRILVNKFKDDVKQQWCYRPLGGGIEFCETAAAALQREIKEEIGQKVSRLRLLGVSENIFNYQGKPGHEIVFVYDGELNDATLVTTAAVQGQESDGTPFEAQWCGYKHFTSETPLYPNGLLDLLRFNRMLLPSEA